KSLDNTSSILCGLCLARTKIRSGKTAKHLSAVLFEEFSAFFDEDGLTPIKAKKSEITERVRRQAAGVRLPSALA
ncbi:MAG: hypothetical protein KIG31_05575, partial [Oscillospiraceae bacterium]|nr:hypothetical protein [Oscillospiraceae bacterium]